MSALIVIEGIDGAGTTTQAQRLAETLRSAGRPVHVTCEPSTGPIGVLLRQFLAGQHSPADDRALGLLFAADRMDHLAREIEPGLAKGQVVISDRYYHSSLAYQGSSEQRAWIQELNRHARVPQLTVFLRIDPRAAAERRSARDSEEEIFEDLGTQQRVAKAYESVIENLIAAGQRIECIDGAQSPEQIAAAVKDMVDQTLEGR